MISDLQIKEYNKKLAQHDLALVFSDQGLCLTDGKLQIMADFREMLPRLKQSNLQREMLVKAARIKGQEMPQTLVDATAGFGEDSLILAAAGFQVRLYEFDEIIAVLLQDCMERAAEIPELKAAVGRMELICGDSVEGMKNLDYTPDIVLLDPMFPARQKSGLIKKKFQLIQRLESPCSTENELLEAAEMAGPKRIVIKRPLKGPYLADRKPSYSLEGKAIRYDCMVYAR
ncbi:MULTISPECIES: class I SAM-dependent methyltransferase [Pseudobutyrivibrio]|uniref:Ribosomal RNA small subunit methyltransferase J n=2 Tax=Pseudobutyrivibrio xylanivorans TaxID=185007 RepID=A0A1M6DC31_PSEXY|nr:MULTISPECIES: class I SAM-dependent methyltransferase [Pseudobutyrivibrio]MDC7279085.1 class I SAM-dependent methyltransferase [Butyrivibrio fibrisolvens]SCZ76140.1 16S rRNA (guanine1516-N2)-methyltransferase [Pseudobutyrivibrio xylanivorans]SHI70806.1 16S rRNA (guanine1516-N2)-methyltransferase [Pseudobutyrivibrio xylanivorans DSM 14809]